MKRLGRIVLCALLLICFCTTAVAIEPATLSEGERHFLENRGIHAEDLLTMSQQEVDRLLLPYRTLLITRGGMLRSPSNYIAVTNIPGQSGTEYFHPSTGMIKGSFWNQPDQYNMLNGPAVFASYVLNYDSQYPSLAQSKIYYYMWGEWDDVAGTHQGVDFNPGAGRPVHSAHSGTVVVAGDKYGTVAIYNAADNVTHYYLHMSNISVKLNQTVTVGTKLGLVSNTHPSGNIPAHLHYEVHAGRTTISKPTNNGLQTLSPYYYMYKDIPIQPGRAPQRPL